MGIEFGRMVGGAEFRVEGPEKEGDLELKEERKGARGEEELRSGEEERANEGVEGADFE